jgi:hypothetical protein
MRKKKTPSLDVNGLKQDKSSKTISKSNLVEDQANQHFDSEIALQEKSLAFLLDAVEVVDFSLEKEPKLVQWKNEINKLKKKVLDKEGNPIDEES